MRNLIGQHFYRNGNVLKRLNACLVDKYVPTKIVKPGVPDKPPWTKFKSVKKAKKKCRQSVTIVTVESVEATSSTNKEPPVRPTGTPFSPGQPSTGTSTHPQQRNLWKHSA